MRQLVYTSFLIIITLLSFWCSHCQLEQISRFFLVLSFPSLRLNLFPNLDGIFLFKWIKETPTQVCEICSKLSIKLTLSLVSDRFHELFQCFHCWLLCKRKTFFLWMLSNMYTYQTLRWKLRPFFFEYQLLLNTK